MDGEVFEIVPSPNGRAPLSSRKTLVLENIHGFCIQAVSISIDNFHVPSISLCFFEARKISTGGAFDKRRAIGVSLVNTL